MSTLLLSRSEVESLLRPADLIEPMQKTFVAYSTGAAPRALRVRADVPSGNGTAMVLFPGTVAGIPAYSVKVHAKFPDELPAIRGLICLHDAGSGALLAAMDSTYITALRTGVAGALGAHVLARHDARTVAVVGAGAQGEWLLRCLALLRPLGPVRVFDLDPGRASAFAERLGRELGLGIAASPSLADAVAEAAIVLTATWAREPFLSPGMLQPGTHVTTMGSDEPGKREVSAALVREALVVCDDRELAVTVGVAQGGEAGSGVVDAELGEVLSGGHPGRTSDDETTVFGGVGLPAQDLVAAWLTYQSARSSGAGRVLDFLE